MDLFPFLTVANNVPFHFIHSSNISEHLVCSQHCALWRSPPLSCLLSSCDPHWVFGGGIKAPAHWAPSTACTISSPGSPECFQVRSTRLILSPGSWDLDRWGDYSRPGIWTLVSLSETFIVFPLVKLLEDKSRSKVEISVFKNALSSYGCILALEAVIKSFMQIKVHPMVIFRAVKLHMRWQTG